MITSEYNRVISTTVNSENSSLTFKSSDSLFLDLNKFVLSLYEKAKEKIKKDMDFIGIKEHQYVLNRFDFFFNGSTFGLRAFGEREESKEEREEREALQNEKMKGKERFKAAREINNKLQALNSALQKLNNHLDPEEMVSINETFKRIKKELQERELP